MRRALTIARIAAVYLLLGFVATWAVAWGLALLPPGARLTHYDQPLAEIDGVTFEVDVQRVSSIGVCRAAFRVDEIEFIRPSESEPSPFFIRPSPPPTLDWEDLANMVDPSGFHGWGMRRVALREGPDSRWQQGIDDARGFPLLALWSSRRLVLRLTVVDSPGYDPDFGPHPVELVGGIELPDHPNQPALYWGELRALPYYPIWSGLALNTAFYALMFFVVVRTLRAFRSGRLRDRGLCPRCKYDREFDYRLPCPECGDAARRRTALVA